MSGSVTLTGNDTIIINNRLLTDLGDADVGGLTFPNAIASLKTGKNGNSIYALNESGKQADVELRVLRGSSDDKFLNGLLSVQSANFAGFILLTGEFIKKLGDGLGNITRDTYIMSGGIFINRVDAKSNVEGDNEQAIAIYKFSFANAPRALT